MKECVCGTKIPKRYQLCRDCEMQFSKNLNYIADLVPELFDLMGNQARINDDENKQIHGSEGSPRLGVRDYEFDLYSDVITFINYFLLESDVAEVSNSPKSVVMKLRSVLNNQNVAGRNDAAVLLSTSRELVSRLKEVFHDREDLAAIPCPNPSCHGDAQIWPMRKRIICRVCGFDEAAGPVAIAAARRLDRRFPEGHSARFCALFCSSFGFEISYQLIAKWKVRGKLSHLHMSTSGKTTYSLEEILRRLL